MWWLRQEDNEMSSWPTHEYIGDIYMIYKCYEIFWRYVLSSWTTHAYIGDINTLYWRYILGIYILYMLSNILKIYWHPGQHMNILGTYICIVCYQIYWTLYIGDIYVLYRLSYILKIYIVILANTCIYWRQCFISYQIYWRFTLSSWPTHPYIDNIKTDIIKKVQN